MSKMSEEHVDNDLPSLAEEPSDLQNTASFNSFFSEDSRTNDSFNGFDHQDADHIKRVATKDMINHMIELDSVQKRLDTFSRWPRDNPVEPLELAKAGFYSTGVDDRVVCFKCDLHLRQWKTGDNPWKEHKLFSPQCPFLEECENERGSHFLCNGVDKSKNLQNSSSLDSSKTEEVVFSEGRLGNHRETTLLALTSLRPTMTPKEWFTPKGNRDFTRENPSARFTETRIILRQVSAINCQTMRREYLHSLRTIFNTYGSSVLITKELREKWLTVQLLCIRDPGRYT